MEPRDEASMLYRPSFHKVEKLSGPAGVWHGEGQAYMYYTCKARVMVAPLDWLISVSVLKISNFGNGCGV